MVKKTYAKVVRTLREKRCWSQEQLAEISGISPRTIQRIEAGSVVSQETLKALASAFMLDVADFHPDVKQSQDHLMESSLLIRLQAGKDVFNLAAGSEAFGYNIDELESESDIEAVGSFLEFVKDWADLWSDIQISSQLKVIHECNALIEDLHARGLWIFGRKSPHFFDAGTHKIPLETVMIGIYKTNNPQIRKGSSIEDIFLQLVKDLEMGTKDTLVQ